MLALQRGPLGLPLDRFIGNFQLRDIRGNTYMHYLASGEGDSFRSHVGHPEAIALVKQLVDKGVDPFSPNNAGTESLLLFCVVYTYVILATGVYPIEVALQNDAQDLAVALLMGMDFEAMTSPIVMSLREQLEAGVFDDLDDTCA